MIPLLGLDPRWLPLISMTMGVITLIYQAEGGMQAVVVTDVMQFLIICVGTAVIIAAMTWGLGSVRAAGRRPG